MAVLPTDTLCQLIDRKHHCLQQLRAIGLRQAELIAQGEMNALLELLVGKQQLLNDVQAIEKAIDPFREEDPDARLWRTEADREQCASKASECALLLNDIVEQEKQNEAQMRTKRDESAVKLQQVHTASHVRAAYSTHTTRRPSASFHDQVADTTTQ